MSDPSPRARIFGSLAEEYERWRPSYPDEAVAWIVPPDATRVADVGAGTGKLTGRLLARGLEVEAVEPDPGMLAVLTRVHPDARPHLAGAEALPLPDGAVDAVLVAQAWHWFPHEQALAEARRVVRPGGWLGLIANTGGYREPWQRELARLHPDMAGVDLDSAPDDEWHLPGLPQGDVVKASFLWTEELTPAALRGRAATHSAFAIMPEGERGDRLDAMSRIVAAECERRGSDTVPFPQVTTCARLPLRS